MAEESALGRGAQGKAMAVNYLRSAILRGDVAPGQRLVEAELVETIGVTRGSVRAAIDELVAEGLLERIHNRGARVRTITLEQAIEILSRRTKNNPVLLGDPASARPRSWRASPSGSSTTTCPRRSPASAWWRSTWRG